MSCKFHKAIFHALLAAALYAVNIPFSKLLLMHLSPTMLAAFLYLGATICWGIENNCTRQIADKQKPKSRVETLKCSSSRNN